MNRVLKIKFSGADEEKLNRVLDAYDTKTDAEVIRILVRDKYLDLSDKDMELSQRIAESYKRKVPTCKHYWKKHYAKGLCKFCYDQERVLIPVTCSIKKKKKMKAQCSFDVITKQYSCNDCNV